MSFFGMGGRPQISSEQKIAQAEAEIDMVSDMYSRYVHFLEFIALVFQIVWEQLAALVVQFSLSLLHGLAGRPLLDAYFVFFGTLALFVNTR
jgi:hypothetical protein